MKFLFAHEEWKWFAVNQGVPLFTMLSKSLIKALLEKFYRTMCWSCNHSTDGCTIFTPSGEGIIFWCCLSVCLLVIVKLCFCTISQQILTGFQLNFVGTFSTVTGCVYPQLIWVGPSKHRVIALEKFCSM